VLLIGAYGQFRSQIMKVEILFLMSAFLSWYVGSVNITSNFYHRKQIDPASWTVLSENADLRFHF